MNIFGGIEFLEDPYMPEFREVPNRVLPWKRWMMRRSYHRRVQRKWNRRFGFTEERNLVAAGRYLIGHPNTLRAISEALREEYRGRCDSRFTDAALRSFSGLPEIPDSVFVPDMTTTTRGVRF